MGPTVPACSGLLGPYPTLILYMDLRYYMYSMASRKSKEQKASALQLHRTNNPGRGTLKVTGTTYSHSKHRRRFRSAHWMRAEFVV